MSLVYITHHTENVRDYEDMYSTVYTASTSRDAKSVQKRSIRKKPYQPFITDGPDGVKLIQDKGRHARRTMGCARTPLAPPSGFLRKNQGLKWRRLRDHICPKPSGHVPVTRRSQMPPLPPCRSKTHTAADKAAESSNIQDKTCPRKNFIAINRNRAIQAKAKRPPPRFVDTPFGDSQNLLNSGLIPQYVCGNNFAKVPRYINSHKKLLQKYKAACAQNIQTLESCDKYMEAHGVRKMSVEERVKLIEGLKINYVDVLKTYQSLSLYTDTPTKRLKKSRLEKELVQLEADIKFLEGNPVIYISDY